MEFWIKGVGPCRPTSFLFVTIIILTIFECWSSSYFRWLVTCWTHLNSWWCFCLFPLLRSLSFWRKCSSFSSLASFDHFIHIWAEQLMGKLRSKLFYSQSPPVFTSPPRNYPWGFTQVNTNNSGTWNLFAKLDISWFTDIFLKSSIGSVSNILEEIWVMLVIIIPSPFLECLWRLQASAISVIKSSFVCSFCDCIQLIHSREFFFLRWWLAFCKKYPLFSLPAERKLATVLKSQSIP